MGTGIGWWPQTEVSSRSGMRRSTAPWGARRLNAPVVDIAPTSDGHGYWLVATDGGIFSFGDARFQGSMGGSHLNRPVVGIAPDYATGGYWGVATDGGIFSFGAPFFGSTGSMHLNQPVNGMTATTNDRGYWFVASDGGIFAFGNAQFHGSMGGSHLNAPIVGMATDSATNGYWLVDQMVGSSASMLLFFGCWLITCSNSWSSAPRWPKVAPEGFDYRLRWLRRSSSACQAEDRQ